MPKTKILAIFSMLCVFAAMCISGYFNFSSRGFDWYYFDSLAVVVRSAIWQYKTWPIHDPWACSGTSILANPQNWLFSPSMIFTLLFPANFGNWLSLLVFKAFGFFGLYSYLRYKKVDGAICWLAAAWFVNLNWFSLHFAEGHLVFRGFYLLPWLLLWTEKISEPKSYLRLVAAFSFLILDGGIYPAIFGFLFCFLRLAIDRTQWLPISNFVRTQIILVVGGLIASLFILLAKVYPVMVNSENLKSFQEQLILPVRYVFRSLFDPTLNNGEVVEANLRFHELGNFLGIGFCLILLALFIGREKLNRSAIVFGFLALVFGWMSFGWGGDFNPYKIISNLPFVDKLHVQTRYGIIFTFSLILFLSLWMSGKVPKRMFYSLLILVNVECLAANYFSYFQEGESYELALIKKEVWTKTIANKPKPLIYYSNDEVSKTCYEPSHEKSFTTAEGEPGYRGEVESLTEPTASADLLLLTPGKIRFSYISKVPAKIVVNSHYLDGWVTEDAKQSVSDFNGRILLEVPAGQGDVVLNYRPSYLYWIILSYICGLGLFVFLVRRVE